MNEYEGLNLPQLLALMHEIALPEAVPSTPEGPGWWVLLGWLAVTGALLARHLLARRKANAYRREALAALREIAANQALDASQAATEIAILVKRTALAAYPRELVAPLYGDDWAQFLRDSADNDPIVSAAAGELAHAAYRKGADGGTLAAPARRWISVHRA